MAEFAGHTDVGVGGQHDAAVPELIGDHFQVRPSGRRPGSNPAVLGGAAAGALY
jgi:hypothetical protein